MEKAREERDRAERQGTFTIVSLVSTIYLNTFFMHNLRLGRPVENYGGVGRNFLSRMKSTVSSSREKHMTTT